MQIICFLFAAAILLGNVRLLKVSGFNILLIKHKIYQVNIRLFKKIHHFWDRDGIWACNPSKKGFFFNLLCPHIILKKAMMRYVMKNFQNDTRYSPLLLINQTISKIYLALKTATCSPTILKLQNF